MKLRWTLLPMVALVTLAAAEARAAVVAVMPVQSPNLSQGQCDAVGVLFTNAFARETNVAVASPLETRPLLAQGMPAQAVVAQIGAIEFVDLNAVQLADRVSLAGIRYGKAGNEVFRSETWAPSIDDMEAAVARLARALAWRQPIVYAPMAASGMVGPPPSVDTPESAPRNSVFGLKTSLILPFTTFDSSGRSYAPLIALQFDGRIGNRRSFIEFGAGAAIPNSGNGKVQMGGVFAELGGSVYLTDGSIAPYVGAGVSPQLWGVSVPNANSNGGAMFAAYGQVGVTLTRDARTKLYAELRFTQYLLGMTETPYQNYSTTSSSSSSSSSGTTLYPGELGIQIGVGW